MSIQTMSQRRIDKLLIAARLSIHNQMFAANTKRCMRMYMKDKQRKWDVRVMWGNEICS